MDEEDNNKLLIWQCCWRISQICKETLFIEWPQADNKGTASRIERQKEWGSWLICGGVYMGSQSRHKSRTELRENRGFFRKQFHMKTGRTPRKTWPFPNLFVISHNKHNEQCSYFRQNSNPLVLLSLVNKRCTSEKIPESCLISADNAPIISHIKVSNITAK